MKKKVVISTCLLGQYCRYDGKIKRVNEVLEAFKECEIIPFCPEAPLFGTPRERINVVEIDNKNRIVTDATDKDVTELLEAEINTFIKSNPNVDAIVLKSKSPSCGFGTTPVLNQNKEQIKIGNGIAGELFQKHYKVDIKEETNFHPL